MRPENIKFFFGEKCYWVVDVKQWIIKWEEEKTCIEWEDCTVQWLKSHKQNVLREWEKCEKKKKKSKTKEVRIRMLIYVLCV